MILVDSRVWIDYFNGVLTLETDLLDGLLGREPVAVRDLVLAEVLQGFRKESDHRAARDLLSSLAVFEMLGAAHSIKVALNCRAVLEPIRCIFMLPAGRARGAGSRLRWMPGQNNYRRCLSTGGAQQCLT